MTDAISVQDLIATMAELEAKGAVARRNLQDARDEFQTVRTEVTQFKRKYGRVLQMMKED